MHSQSSEHPPWYGELSPSRLLSQAQEAPSEVLPGSRDPACCLGAGLLVSLLPGVQDPRPGHTHMIASPALSAAIP